MKPWSARAWVVGDESVFPFIITVTCFRREKHALQRAPERPRNDPSVQGTSNLSPYLHFRIIAPLEVAWSAKAAGKNRISTEAFLEELIVRRELSYNFTRFSKDYESLQALPRWIQENLSRHANDRRPYIYSLPEFEQAKTHDPIWNACQQELLTVGKIHGYLRMYWGKKIIERGVAVSDAKSGLTYFFFAGILR